MSQPLKELQRKASAQGWKILKGGSNHLKWYSPDGRTLVVTGSTESDRRAIHNTKARMRRAGFHE